MEGWWFTGKNRIEQDNYHTDESENVGFHPTGAKNEEKAKSETLTGNIYVNPDLNLDPIFIILTRKKKLRK